MCFQRFPIVLLLVFLIPPYFSLQAQITTQAQWDSFYQENYPNQPPMLDVKNNEEGLFSWQAYYWIRAYISMAGTFQESSYLEKAVALIDHILNNTDDARYARNELDLENEPYFSAPLPYLQNRNLPAPGWRIGAFGDGWRIQTLDDGQIAQAIMRFVDLVTGVPKWQAYHKKAQEYLEQVEKIVRGHNSLFEFNRFPKVPGTYFYPQPDGTGLWSGDVPFNHAATMGKTLLFLDRARGGDTEYRDKAEAILQYFKLNAQTRENNSLVWKYQFRDEDSPVEDFNHAHLDIGFLILAYQCGLDLSKAEMQQLSNTLTENVFRNDNSLNWFIDGTTDESQESFWPIGFDWIDLAEFNPTIFETAKAYYSTHYPTPTWSRPFLGWAEILRWTHQKPYQLDTLAPDPPQNVNVEY